MWSVAVLYYICMCQVQTGVTHWGESEYIVALNRRIGMAAHRSVQRAARGEIWENISTPGCQISACSPLHTELVDQIHILQNTGIEP